MHKAWILARNSWYLDGHNTMNLVSLSRASLNCQGTLVLMHGLGSDEQDMFGLAEQIDPRVEVICLRAPHVYGPGYAWFDVQWTAQGILADPAQVKSSVECVSTYLQGLNAEKLVVGGFSQGAMMALGTLQECPTILTGAALLSGREIGSTRPEFSGQVFQAHGTFDDVISIREAISLRDQLQPFGDRFQYHQYDMGHWICDEELRDLNHWLEKTLDLK
jgi:phospholipase/carboxylesterase